jgi:ATP-dependent DNA helicase RecG
MLENNKSDLRRALLAITTLKQDNYQKLKKLLGVGIYLYRLIKDHINHPIKEDLKIFDKYSFERKVAILEFLEELIQNKLEKPKINLHREVKPFETFLEPIEKVKFLTTKEKQFLKGLGIKTILDALYYFPHKYEDRRLNKSLKYTKPGTKVCVLVKVEGIRKLPEGDLYNYEVITTDGTETLHLKFRYKDIRALYRFKKGRRLVIYGTLKQYKGEKYMVHPQIFEPDSEEVGRIIPIYYARKKGELVEISSKRQKKVISKLLKNIVLEYAPKIPEVLPVQILERYGFPSNDVAFLNIHMPPNRENFHDLEQRNTPYQKRFIYEDLLVLSLALLLQKSKLKELKAPKVEVDIDKFLQEFESKLPFKLTNAQRRVIRQILEDMSKEEPMNRLLQGDVGSGKTIVAIAATLAAAKSGYQVAVMAPTEILAQQHFKNFQKFLVDTGFLRRDEIMLLTGSLTPSLKRKIKNLIALGAVKVVIGTHALVQDDVEFKNLGLAIIDEQHRFGVIQRKKLLEKGKGYYPHTLVMTATPIPRTLTLTLYGDLDVSILDEMPAGRKPVLTRLIYDSERSKLYTFIRRELERGNKVYVIYPLVEESEKINLKSATEQWQKWKELFPDKKVLLLHGRMKDEEKRRVMEEFKKDGHILVSTTVVEVGVDVPEATVMVIEDAHRFGLAQLHQLRGRVGRSERQSYCFLVVPDELKEKAQEETLKRLKVFVSTTDGFKIAEADLQIRGGGNVLGTQQAGQFTLPIADLSREEDRKILEIARRDAKKILELTPNLEKLPNLKKLVFYRYGDTMELGSVG